MAREWDGQPPAVPPRAGHGADRTTPASRRRTADGVAAATAGRRGRVASSGSSGTGDPAAAGTGARPSRPERPSRADKETLSRTEKGPQRPSRITEARGYHPRGRTVGEPDSADPGPTAGRPNLRLVTGTGTPTPRRRTTPPAAGPSTSDTRTAARTTARTPAARAAAVRRSDRRRLVTVASGGSARRDAPRVELPKLANPNQRLRATLALVLVVLVVLGGRLVQFQFTDGAAYAAAGLSLRLQPVDLPAPRGSIMDRNLAVLAGSNEARYVFVDPALVKDPAAVVDALSPILGIPRSDLLPKVTPHTYDDGTAARFEYLARGITVPMGNAVSALKIAGIGVRRDETRLVPGHDLAANLIGYTGSDLTGLGGLEESYNDLLRGVDGKRTYEIGQPDGPVDLDQEIPGGYHEETPARPGSSLVLTIDRDLQFEIQRMLGAKMQQEKASVGAAVVLDVRTGEVLAQASYPFFDAANPFASDPADRGDNASGYVVEPGSVHKGIVFAACLQQGVVAPTDALLVPTSITKGSTTFTDTHWHRTPNLTLPEILAWSSNVGTIELADKLGPDKLYQYQRAFGLGDKTDEGLPGESGGLVQPPANWSPDSHGSIPIGHGVSVTPLQMAAVYATIANGGVYVEPHLVKSIVAPDGTVTPTRAPTTRRVISAENAATLRTMLEAVVTADGGTGHSAAIADYRVAGKTGTGREIQNGQPIPGEVGSFVGMAPADAPRYVIAVFTHTPGGEGGAVAGPAFSEMMNFTLLHYAVAPTGTPLPTFHFDP
jgi:cell division protein FtsI (penicillin-binding protein 3)